MEEKKIHIYYVNKIKKLDLKIFEYEDDDYPDRRAISVCEKHIEKWLDKAGITDEDSRMEVRSCCSWSSDKCSEELTKLGWKVLTGFGGL